MVEGIDGSAGAACAVTPGWGLINHAGLRAGTAGRAAREAEVGTAAVAVVSIPVRSGTRLAEAPVALVTARVGRAGRERRKTTVAVVTRALRLGAFARALTVALVDDVTATLWAVEAVVVEVDEDSDAATRRFSGSLTESRCNIVSVRRACSSSVAPQTHGAPMARQSPDRRSNRTAREIKSNEEL